MPLNDENDLVRSLNELAAAPVSAEAWAGALEATRAAILREQAARGARRRVLRRISILSGMAACVLAAALAGLAVQRSARASTAQQFREVVRAAQAKTGWVHLATVQASAAGGTTSAGAQVRITYHSNPAEGLLGIVRQSGAGDADKEIKFYDFNAREVSGYSTRTGVIRIQRVESEDARKITQGLMLPGTIGDTLAQVKDTVGHDPASIRKKSEGRDSCFEVDLFGSEKEEREFHEEHEPRGAVECPASHLEIWVNDRKEMTRLAYHGPHGAMSGDVTYGPPEIRSVYDLGVPRESLIVDDRSQRRDRDD